MKTIKQITALVVLTALTSMAHANPKAVDAKIDEYVKTSCDRDKACIIRTKAVIASFTGILLHEETRKDYFDNLYDIIDEKETRSCERIIEKSGPGLERGPNSENTAYMLMRLTRCK